MASIRMSRITGKEIKMSVVKGGNALSDKEIERIFDAIIKSYDMHIIDALND